MVNKAEAWTLPAAPNRPDGWLHLVVRIGDSTGKPEAFLNGQRVIYSPTGGPSPKSTGSGVVIIGRLYNSEDLHYGSVVVDEMAMWNRALTADEVGQIYNSV